MNISTAYEILIEKGSLYGRFGDFMTDSVKIDKEFTLFYPVLLHSLVFGVSIFIYGLLYSLAAKDLRPRYFYFLYVIFTISCEISLRFGNSHLQHIFDFMPFFGNLLTFEKVRIMKTIAPTVFQGANLYYSRVASARDSIISDCTLFTVYLSQNMKILNSFTNTINRLKAKANLNHATEFVNSSKTRLVIPDPPPGLCMSNETCEKIMNGVFDASDMDAANELLGWNETFASTSQIKTVLGGAFGFIIFIYSIIASS